MEDLWPIKVHCNEAMREFLVKCVEGRTNTLRQMRAKIHNENMQNYLDKELETARICAKELNEAGT